MPYHSAAALALWLRLPTHLQLGGHGPRLADPHHLHNGLDQAQPAQRLQQAHSTGRVVSRRDSA